MDRFVFNADHSFGTDRRSLDRRRAHRLGRFATYGTAPDSDGDYVIGDGAAYNPETDAWRILAESPLGERCDHTLTWTGTEMLAFGGLPQCGDPNVLAYGDAALYDPGSDSWRSTHP